MIIEPTRRPESAMEALGVALRVLARPGFLWVPFFFGLLSALPVLLVPERPAPAAFATDAELWAWYEASLGDLGLMFAILIPTGAILGSAMSAALYRLAGQYLDDARPAAFGTGFVDLAWRMFLQALAAGGIFLGAGLGLGLVIAAGSAVGVQGLAVVVAIVVGAVGIVVFTLRLAIAPALLLSGLGPLEALRRSWVVSRGRSGLVFRWLFVPALIFGGGTMIVGAVVGAILPIDSVNAVSIISSVVVAPLGFVLTIVLLMLSRLLTGGPAPAAAQGVQA